MVCPTVLQPDCTITIIAPDAHFCALGALIHAYREKGICVRTVVVDPSLSPKEVLLSHAESSDAILLSTDGRLAPGVEMTGPYLRNANNKIVPVGVLTARSDKHRVRFAETAARAHHSHTEKTGLAILSQRHPRYVQVARRVETLLSQTEHIDAFRWTSDITIREEMLNGLRQGMGAALYLGHGRSAGWVGYYGLRAHHFEPENSIKPIGVVLSLCCDTAKRRRGAYSFAEQLVMQGSATACLAAVSPTRFTDNTRWAVRLTQAMADGATTLGELMSVMRAADQATAAYRIIGDPLATLYSAQGATTFAKSINTYA